MSKLMCVFCQQMKSMIWYCRVCQAHFCGDCAIGGLFSFTCPKGHRDVMKVKG